jgi:hypothetical protein
MIIFFRKNDHRRLRHQRMNLRRNCRLHYMKILHDYMNRYWMEKKSSLENYWND